MIAVDTNLLVYAHRPESPFHARALEVIESLWCQRDPWGIPMHCLVEFAAIVSNSRIWRTPSSAGQIAEQVAVWEESATLRLLGDDGAVWRHCLELGRRGLCESGAWYDARIAGVCVAHGVAELWTADRDYSRFPGLRTRNPLVAG